MLQERINQDYIQAMKQKHQIKAGTLSFLRAQLKNMMIEHKTDRLEDAQVIAVLKKQVKQRDDSIVQYEKGSRLELAEKEKQEREILKGYLPPEMEEGELRHIIVQVIKEAGAQSMKDMGAVMKSLLPKLAGRADNQRVSKMVQEELGKI